MSRSVSRHPHAVETVFLNHPFEDDEEYGWSDFIEDLRENVLKPRFPSLRICDRSAGREDHVILENQRCEVSVSEYHGIVAVCLAPKDPDNPLDANLAAVCGPGFRKTVVENYHGSALVSQGTCSNGEQIFALVKEPGSCVTSKEGRLW